MMLIKPVRLVLSALVFVIILLAGFFSVLLDRGFQHSLLDAHGSTQRVPEAFLHSDLLVSYLFGKSELPSQFTASEASHMADVKNLITWAGFALLVSVIFFAAAFMYYKKSVRGALLKGSVAVIIFSSVLAVASAYFSGLFDVFHRVFFPQGNYMFSPSDLLIQLYPESFFFDFFYQCVLRSFLVSVLVISWVLFEIFRRRFGLLQKK